MSYASAAISLIVHVCWAAGGAGGPAAHVQAARAHALEAAFSDEDDYFDLEADLPGAGVSVGSSACIQACMHESANPLLQNM